VDAAIVAKIAEEVGFESMFYGEHPFTPLNDPGHVVHSSGVPFFQDTLVALARASAVTTRITLGAGVFLIPLSIPLLATLVSPNKWRGRPRPAPVGAPPPAYGQPPMQAQQPLQPQFDQPPMYDSQPAGYGGNPPMGAPYSGPPAYGQPPGSPVGYPEPGQYGGGQPGYPPDQLRPDVTRRIQ
jgi:hypothetical protein